MSEDDSSTPAQASAHELPDRNDKRRSWFERISSALSGEPSSREDLVEVLRECQSDGLIEADTLTMMEGAIAISGLSVGDVMIPRSQMVMLPAEMPFQQLVEQVVESGHSRFPVHGEDKDQIIGILLAKDLLQGVVAESGAPSIHALVRPAVLIPESKRLNILLREFRQSRNHMAIVIDEHGGVAGLLTIEDVLEQIVGDIDDEHDEAEDPDALISAQADGQFMVDALAPIEDFNDHFGAKFDDDEYDTIGGLVIAAIGHLPESGEELILGRFVFRVASADARRVHTFHVSVLGDA